MKSEILTAIEKMQQRLESILKEADDIKKAINVMRKTIDMEPLYDEGNKSGWVVRQNIKPDQYFGMSLAGAVKKVIRERGRAMHPAQIIDQLENGGFNFPEHWQDRKDYVRFLAISLSKNRSDFAPVQTPSGQVYGLWEFYPKSGKTGKKIHSKFDDLIASQNKSKLVRHVQYLPHNRGDDEETNFEDDVNEGYHDPFADENDDSASRK